MIVWIIIGIALIVLISYIYYPNEKKTYNLPSCHLLNNANIYGLTVDKARAKHALSMYGAPVPQSIYLRYGEIYSMPSNELKQTIERLMRSNNLEYPVVMKPTHGECGKGIVTSIMNINNLMESVEKYIASKTDQSDLLIERQYDGQVYRITYINKKLVGIIERNHPIVTGDGIHTIGRLVELMNKRVNPDHHIVINNYFIGNRGYALKSVLEKGKILAVTNKLDFTGCRQKNIPIETIHPMNKRMFDRLFDMLDIDCVGVDYISTDITKPYYETDGVILELNSRPDRIIHNRIDPLFKDRYMAEFARLSNK